MLPGILGSDSNGLAGDRVDGQLYDPTDPYAEVDWTDEHVYQTRWSYTATGDREWGVDREPGDILWSGGLHDARAVTKTPLVPTAGHVPGDPLPPRLIDHIRANHAMTPAVTRLDTITTVDECSDHRPLVAEIDLEQLVA